MNLLWSMSICLVTAGSVSAQTAEETVAYIMKGAEDGTSTKAFNGGRWKQTRKNSSAAQYIIEGPDNSEEISVTKIAGCRYRLSEVRFFTEPKRSVSIANDFELDFTNAREYAVKLQGESGFAFEINGMEDTCRPHPDFPKARNCENGLRFYNWGDLARAQKALQYLKKEFCPSGAF